MRGWWQDLLSGTRSRAEVSALAEGWARGSRLVECPFARRGLWHLYRAGLLDAETGAPVRSRSELLAAYETWCADQVLAAHDPQAWRLVARDRTLAVLEASRSAGRPLRRRPSLSRMH
ncbi:hypothetical protein [Kineosporia sp. NBRC 101731]|uniref:hypothetical protein n=1 Tax=Kineosporia sp. NBRC 101731 TaxID=3032199 RepID=UPI0025579230|nr:hypothetical protein [Kineosporia sp. NBRC 101731]